MLRWRDGYRIPACVGSRCVTVADSNLYAARRAAILAGVDLDRHRLDSGLLAVGRPDPLDPDEAHDAQLTRELMRMGRPVPPPRRQALHPQAGPLSLAARRRCLLLGDTEFASRLPTGSPRSCCSPSRDGLARSCSGLRSANGVHRRSRRSRRPSRCRPSRSSTCRSPRSSSGRWAADRRRDTRRRRDHGDAAEQPRLDGAGYGPGGVGITARKGLVALVVVGEGLDRGRPLPGDTRAHPPRLDWKSRSLAVAAGRVAVVPWMAWRFGQEFIQGCTYPPAELLDDFTQLAQFSARAGMITSTYAPSPAPSSVEVSSSLAARSTSSRALRMGGRPPGGEHCCGSGGDVVIGFFQDRALQAGQS